MSKPILPKVALIGRTNVGKSTLFNRLVENAHALTSDISGTTRDRREGWCLWRGNVIELIDTGGLDVNESDVIEREVVKQAQIAMQQCDVILFVVDLKAGRLPQDDVMIRLLRKANKPIIVVGNKADSISYVQSVDEQQWRVGGLPAPMPTSAVKGTGIGDILDLVYEQLAKLGKKPIPYPEIAPISVAVVGKPNVGKSSLLNAILGEERFITSPVAHTTREPNDVYIEYKDKDFVLMDTAGIRKLNRVRNAGGLEAAGVAYTQRLIRKADVVLFVIDVTEPIGSQERTLAGVIAESGVGCIVIANKWDLVENKNPNTINEYADYVKSSLPFLAWAPIFFVSAKTGKRIPEIFDWILDVQTHRNVEIPDEQMDIFWRQAIKRHLPSRGKGPVPPKMLGMKQTQTKPPTFVLSIKAKRLDVLHPSYLRFLENRMREEYDLSGTPVRIHVQGITSV